MNWFLVNAVALYDIGGSEDELSVRDHGRELGSYLGLPICLSYEFMRLVRASSHCEPRY